MALSPQTAQRPSLPAVDAPVDLVSVRAALAAADGTPAEAAGAEWGGDGMAKWPTAAATSLLDDDIDEPGVVGVAGDWTGPAADDELTVHGDGSLPTQHHRPPPSQMQRKQNGNVEAVIIQMHVNNLIC